MHARLCLSIVSGVQVLAYCCKDAFSAFNYMEKGFSDFSHYPGKCGTRLAGLRSQTNLMQSSPPQANKERGDGNRRGEEDGESESI